jgi:hypothetical protein
MIEIIYSVGNQSGISVNLLELSVFFGVLHFGQGGVPGQGDAILKVTSLVY